MKFIDSHSHLFDASFDEDRGAVIDRALSAGVYKICLPNIDVSTTAAMMSMVKRWPDCCYPMIGLHPGSVKADFKEQLALLYQQLENEVFCAIGEVGLDFYWDLTYKAEQEQAFEEQICWAGDFHLPLVIHTRNSIDEGIRQVKARQKGQLSGVFHCFGGTIEQAKEVLDLGFYLGIGGIATFKNGGLEPLLQEVPLESILLETDAPYLAPVPYRGKRNESAYIPLIAERIASIKQINVEEVAAVTTKNCLNLFGL